MCDREFELQEIGVERMFLYLFVSFAVRYDSLICRRWGWRVWWCSHISFVSFAVSVCNREFELQERGVEGGS